MSCLVIVWVESLHTHTKVQTLHVCVCVSADSSRSVCERCNHVVLNASATEEHPSILAPPLPLWLTVYFQFIMIVQLLLDLKKCESLGCFSSF